MNDIAVLIPCYNEALTIARVIQDFRQELPEAKIYVYDNNSSDNTALIAQENGAIVMQEYQPFPTYDGFVMSDPEGRWIEIMEYTHPNFRVQEFTNQPAGECGLRMIGFIEIVRDLQAMTDWYQRALDLRVLNSNGNGAGGSVELVDKYYDAGERNTVMILSDASTDEEKASLARTGPYISAILYEALDLDRAVEDAEWAGMEVVSEISADEHSGGRMARLREPSGNLIHLREA